MFHCYKFSVGICRLAECILFGPVFCVVYVLFGGYCVLMLRSVTIC